MQLMDENGVDRVQSLTPAPVGDVPVEKLREVAGTEHTLWGGLPGAYFSYLYPEKVLIEMAVDIINYYLQGHKFIMVWPIRFRLMAI